MRWRLASAAGVCLALLAGSGAAHAQEESVTLKRATELKAKPGDPQAGTPLPADSSVTRLPERQGPWVRVRTAAGAVGWVHLFDLGTSGSASAGSGSGSGAASGLLRGVTGLFGKPAQPTTVSTSAIGIRGLGAQDLAQAQPDTAAVARMEALRVSESQAAKFARDAGVASAHVEALPGPSRTGNGTPGGPQ